MGGKKTESCGRCSVTTVIDATEREEGDETSGGKNPFDGERIEIEESTMRSAVPHEVAVRRVKNRLDGFVSNLTWGSKAK